jgi:hypothetical protein
MYPLIAGIAPLTHPKDGYKPDFTQREMKNWGSLPGGVATRPIVQPLVSPLKDYEAGVEDFLMAHARRVKAATRSLNGSPSGSNATSRASSPPKMSPPKTVDDLRAEAQEKVRHEAFLQQFKARSMEAAEEPAGTIAFRLWGEEVYVVKETVGTGAAAIEDYATLVEFRCVIDASASFDEISFGEKVADVVRLHPSSVTVEVARGGKDLTVTCAIEAAGKYEATRVTEALAAIIRSPKGPGATFNLMFISCSEPSVVKASHGKASSAKVGTGKGGRAKGGIKRVGSPAVSYRGAGAAAADQAVLAEARVAKANERVADLEARAARGDALSQVELEELESVKVELRTAEEEYSVAFAAAVALSDGATGLGEAEADEKVELGVELDDEAVHAADIAVELGGSSEAAREAAPRATKRVKKARISTVQPRVEPGFKPRPVEATFNMVLGGDMGEFDRIQYRTRLAEILSVDPAEVRLILLDAGDGTFTVTAKLNVATASAAEELSQTANAAIGTAEAATAMLGGGNFTVASVEAVKTCERKVHPGTPKEVMDELFDLIEEREIIDAFVSMDTDGSGALDRSEMHAVLQMLIPSITEEQADAIFRFLDQSDDGIVILPEFLRAKYGERRKSMGDRLMAPVDDEAAARMGAASFADLQSRARNKASRCLERAAQREEERLAKARSRQLKDKRKLEKLDVRLEREGRAEAAAREAMLAKEEVAEQQRIRRQQVQAAELLLEQERDRKSVV